MEQKKHSLTVLQAEILLAAVIFARSTSFVVLKTCLEDVAPFMLMAIRSIIAFVLVALIFRKKLLQMSKRTLLRGLILGTLFFGVMSCELYGLKGVESSTAALIENSALVMVPVVESVLRHRLPKPLVIVCDVLAIIGIFLLSYNGEMGVSHSAYFSMAAAVFYTIGIICTDRFSRKDDPITLGVLEVGFMGFFSLIASLIIGTTAFPSRGMTWLFILFLAIVCSGFGFTLQPLAQSRVPSERVSLFVAICPLSASLLGVIILDERFSTMGLIGACLILSSIIVSIVFGSREEKS